MVNLVRVKRKRGLPSPAGRLYVDVNGDRLVADNLMAGLSLGSSEANGEASSVQDRPRRAKRYRRIIGNMTLLELEAQAFREGFEAGVTQPGTTGQAHVAVAGEDRPAVTRPITTNDEKEIREDAPEVGNVGGVEIEEATKKGAIETVAMQGSSNGKRKQCSMIYAVVKRRRESRHMAAASERELDGSLELDPLRRLGGGYRVCDLEFTPSTPDAKSRAGEEDALYDLYVEEEEDDDRGGGGCSVGNGLVSSSCAVVYVDDGDFFMPEFDEDHETSDGFGSDDSNAEEYYLNDYPEEEDDDVDDVDEDGVAFGVARAGHGFGWDSDEGGSGTDSDAWDSEDS